MQLKEGAEGFPAAVPWWNTQAFKWRLPLGGLLLVSLLVFLKDLMGMSTQQFWQDSFCLLMVILGAMAVVLHAVIYGEAQADENHEALCARWYMARTQLLLEGIDGQVFHNRVVSAAELRVLHQERTCPGLNIYCQSGNRLLELHFVDLRSRPHLRHLRELDETTARAYFLQHNREVYENLYGTPEHW